MTSTLAPLWAWLRLDLRRRIRALVLLGLLVAVGSGTVMSAAAGARRADSAMDRLLAATLPAHAMVQPNRPGFDWDAVRRLPGVAAVGTFLLSDLTLEGLPGAALSYPSLDPTFMTTMERPAVVAGRLPDNTRADEAVATEMFLEANGVKLGDTVVAGFGEGRAAAGLRQPLRVVGVIRTPALLTYPELVTTTAFAQRYRTALMESSGGIANAIVRLTGGPAALPQFRTAFAELTGRDDIEIQDLAEVAENRARANTFEAGILAGMALAALVCALALIGQAVARYASDSVDDLAVLRVLGLTPRQAVLTAAAGPGIAATGGLAVGVAAALAVSPLFPIGGARTVEPDPGVSADLAVFAAVAVAVLLLVAAVAAIAVRPSLVAGVGRPYPDRRSTPRSALVKLVERAGLPVPIGLGVRFALEPGNRGLAAVPTRPALAGAVVGVLGVVAALTFRAGAVDAVAEPARFGQTFQLMSMTGWDGEELAPVPADAIARDPGVLAAVDTRVGVASAGATSVTLYTYEPVSRPFPVVALAGRMPTAPDEIALAPGSARKAGASVGSVLPLKARAAGKLTVTGIVFVPEGPHNRYAEGGWITGDGYRRLFPDDFFKFHMVLLTLREGTDRAAVSARLGLELHPAMVPAQVAQIDNILVLPLALGVFLALLALGVNAHTLATGVHRRRHDIAVMRALGLTPRQCRQAILTQGLTFAAIGLLFGVPLGLALGRTLWRVVSDITPLWYAPPIALGIALVTVPSVLVLGALLAVRPTRRVTRYSVGDCLRTT
ncbi:hypothetical protein Aph01nite_47960 [Acrocarpospora phusangensis]|uniref:ABC3 transporter permease C-terminal domain-containing protein n=1 Tax=Acrocarpospora phusangensis TaxID=1070424 RepID=A0A919QCT7_9ACTN|nr:ABC transporter permease [Acrocarpospora phusangensis]GIH26486.1 hypothetical protein Aph01nite_47960 [Acrocarpospora phusangensis]